MIKTSVILFILFYLTSANAAQTVDKLNSNQLRLPKETISKALSIDANGQVKSSSTSSTELGYLSGASSNVQDQINDKANDADAVHLTGDESIAGVKTLTGKLVTSSTVNASIPCPVMTQTQRDAIATPVTGDCVFNSNTSLSNIYDGAIWKAMGGSGGGIGLWVTANGYAVDDVVIESNNIYICLTAHTSGTFATDLASLYWLRLSTDVTGATGLLPLAAGGTNKSITASNGSIIYSDADSLELLSPGTSGQILQTNGAAAPTFVNKSISGKAQNKASVISEEIQFPNNLLTETGTNKYLNESGNKNILDNPSFEHSTFSTSWTNSAGTFTQELTSVIDGKSSAKLVLSSQAFSLSQSSTLYAAQFADGVQGLTMVRIKSDVAVKVCSIQAGTVSTTNCVTTSTDLKWGLYKVPFILGTTSNGISIASSGAVSGTVYIDDAFVGAVNLQSDIPASEMYGKVSMASDCTWSRVSAGAFADFATDGTCTQTTSGKITSVAGQPAIVLPAGSPAGDYHVSMTGSFGSTHGSTTAITECEFRFTDGVTGYSLGTVTNVSNNSTVVSARVASLAGTITLNSPLTSATTYTVQGRTTQGSNVNESCRINNGNLIALQTNFSVMYFPKNPVSTYSASCGADCVDTYSAIIASTTTDVVTSENVDFINGNCTTATVGRSTCTFNSGIATQALSCGCSPVINAANRGCSVLVQSSSSVLVSTTSGGVEADGIGFNLICQKQGADFIATRTIVGSFNEVMTSPGISKPKTCHYAFGGAAATLAAPTVCSTGTCVEVVDSCGAVTPPSFSSTGVYTDATITNGTFSASSHLKCFCVANTTTSAQQNGCTIPFYTGDQTWMTNSSGGAVLNFATNDPAGTARNSYISFSCEGSAP